MDIRETGLAGLLIIEPRSYGDPRGFFLESYQDRRYSDAGIRDVFVQDNLSRSSAGILRGMHYQIERPQAQILTIVRGRIFDAVVDLRPDSPTFGRWFGAVLSDEGPRQIYMAPGFAHGFCVLSDVADLHYKVSQRYDHDDEAGLLWNDPTVDIIWPVEHPQLSPRDAAYPTLKSISRDRLPHLPASVPTSGTAL